MILMTSIICKKKIKNRNLLWPNVPKDVVTSKIKLKNQNLFSLTTYVAGTNLFKKYQSRITVCEEYSRGQHLITHFHF